MLGADMIRLFVALVVFILAIQLLDFGINTTIHEQYVIA